MSRLRLAATLLALAALLVVVGWVLTQPSVTDPPHPQVTDR